MSMRIILISRNTFGYTPFELIESSILSSSHVDIDINHLVELEIKQIRRSPRDQHGLVYNISKV